MMPTPAYKSTDTIATAFIWKALAVGRASETRQGRSPSAVRRSVKPTPRTV
jgi:hypothetical protein